MGYGTQTSERYFKDPKKLQGIAFILLVSIIWVIASFVVQDIQNRGVNAAVLTFISNSLFVVYLPVYWLNVQIRQRQSIKTDSEQTSLVPLESAHSDNLAQPLKPEYCDETVPAGTFSQVLKAAMLVGPLWYAAQFTFNLSLAHTSVTSNTVLSSTSALFTFLMSVCLLSELYSVAKLVCIFFLMAGTAVYTLADTTTNKDLGKQTLGGDMLVLASAFLYASYTVTIRKLLTAQVSMTLFFGFMGLVILVGFGLPLLLFWICGFHLGTLTWSTLGLVIAKGLLDNVFSDYLWAKAILLIGPTLSTAGLSLQIPIAVMVDLLFRNPTWMHRAGSILLTLLGGGLIVAGFLGITFNASRESEPELITTEHEENELPEETGDRFGSQTTLTLPLPREGPLSEGPMSSTSQQRYAALATRNME